MEERVLREPLRLPSGDGETDLHGFVWRAEGASAGGRPKGVVQLAHGMAEHIGRYDEFARFLAGAGYVVGGFDQIGHGASADPARYGKLPAARGKDILVEDQHRMRLRMERDFPGVPRFMFGHSLGSYIMRAYIARHGEGLAGCVLCGTGHVPPAASHAGNLMARAICRLRGEDACSTRLDALGAGGYNRGIRNPRTACDWLSRDEGNVDRYLADPACGFMFSAGGYAVVTALTAEVCARDAFARVPRTLPLLFIAGAEDPVGDCGAGVRHAAAMAREAGIADVSCTIYDGMRHEILNEAGRGRVFADVLAWLDAHAGQVSVQSAY